MFSSLKISRIDIINYLILLYVFLLSLSVDALRVLIVLMIIIWLTDKDRFKTSIPKPLMIFLFFIAFSLLSYIWGEATLIEVIEHARRYWYLLPTFLIFKYIKQAYIKYSITAFLLGVLISELVSYSIYFQWINPINGASVADPTPFISHTMYSIFLAIASIFLLGRAFHEKNLMLKTIFLIFLLSVSVNLFVNAGRTGQVAFVATLIVLFVHLFRFNLKVVLLTIASIVTISYSAYNLSENFHNRANHAFSDIDGMISSNDYRSSLGVRTGFWIITKEMFVKSPILGVGATNHLSKMKDTVDLKLPHLSFNKNYDHFHNQYWDFLTQFGIIGLSIFLYFLFTIFRVKIINQEIELLKIATMAIFMFSFFADNVFRFNSTMMLFSFIVGVVLAQNKYESRKESASNFNAINNS